MLALFIILCYNYSIIFEVIILAKINWKNKFHQLTESLHSGVSVKETATILGVSYTSLCKFLRECSLDNTGKFRDKVRKSEMLREYFINYILVVCDQIPLICEKYNLSPNQVQYYMKEFAATREWDFSNSSSKNVAIGRKGELFIKNCGDFEVVKDPIKKNSKSPYDLILKSYGAIDVKVTKLRSTPSGGYRWKFNIENLSKPVRNVFLLGYDEKYTEPQVLLIIPFKEIFGHSSISISKDKLSESKYSKFVHKIFIHQDTSSS